jgi:hypothetical protein
LKLSLLRNWTSPAIQVLLLPTKILLLLRSRSKLLLLQTGVVVGSTELTTAQMRRWNVLRLLDLTLTHKIPITTPISGCSLSLAHFGL